MFTIRQAFYMSIKNAICQNLLDGRNEIQNMLSRKYAVRKNLTKSSNNFQVLDQIYKLSQLQKMLHIKSCDRTNCVLCKNDVIRMGKPIFWPFPCRILLKIAFIFQDCFYCNIADIYNVSFDACKQTD